MQLDPDEIRTSKQDLFFKKKQPNRTNPIVKFLAVLAVIILVWFVRVVFIEWQVRSAVKVMNEQMALVAEQAEQNAQRVQMMVQASQAAANEKARVQADKERLQKLAAHQAEVDRQAAMSAEIDLKNKKEQAWLDFYKPVKGCESSNDNRDAIVCGNDFARAKTSFETQWALQHR